MTIFVHKGFTRNPEIKNTSVSNLSETGTSKGYQIWQKCLYLIYLRPGWEQVDTGREHCLSYLPALLQACGEFPLKRTILGVCYKNVLVKACI